MLLEVVGVVDGGSIEQLLQENPRATAMIQADEEADIGVVLDVQDLLMEMDIPVYISTEEP